MALLDQQTGYVYLIRAEFTDRALEDEWNRWYDAEHVPQLLTVPGFVSATRYREHGAEGRYLAAYEVEGPEVFEEERYREVTGWGRWAPYVTDCRRALYRVSEELGAVVT